jgi:hypothetical protein
MTFSNMIQQLKDFLPFLRLNLSLYELSIDTDQGEAIRKARMTEWMCCWAGL